MNQLTIATVADFLERFAPAALAEDWDNVGLLVGDKDQAAMRIMTCLTIAPATLAEAIAEHADLIVAHHPMPLRPIRRLTTESHDGRLLLRLAGAGIAVYSPHTAFDSAREGINRRLAEGLGLIGIEPLTPSANDSDVGVGRMGRLPAPMRLDEMAKHVGHFLRVERLQIVGAAEAMVTTVAVGCGSAGELISLAKQRGCDAFVSGEARFHACLEAESDGIGLILAGHYASERFAVEQLALVLAEQFPAATMWASRRERDPIDWIDVGLATRIASERG